MPLLNFSLKAVFILLILFLEVNMSHELKMIAMKFGATLLFTPVMGYGLMVCAEKFEKTWKTNNRKKKWLATCGMFLILAAISGWFL
jgi:hypothetical protein